MQNQGLNSEGTGSPGISSRARRVRQTLRRTELGVQNGLGQSGRGRRRGWLSTPGLPKKLLPDLSPQVAAARLVHPKDPCGSGTRLPALLTAGWHQERRQKSKAGSRPATTPARDRPRHLC